ncbi:hypothetical protein ABH922_001061 [Rhodococcus sp. 27YEA15]|uniref:hypothetical protein n=1 Tax=Rhodococcus sp. 27YEA15 TaxID=3156259 RepID=UPI003C7DF6AD
MKLRFVMIVVYSGVVAAGCASEGVDGTHPIPLPSTSRAASESVDADAFYLGYGKHAFRLDGVAAGCWFNPNTDTSPHMFCLVDLPATNPPITDQDTGIVAPANSVIIDALTVREAVNVAEGSLVGPVLFDGSTLTVDSLSCTALSSLSMSCTGPGGRFTYDGKARTVTIVDTTSSTAGAQPTS